MPIKTKRQRRRMTVIESDFIKTLELIYWGHCACFQIIGRLIRLKGKNSSGVRCQNIQTHNVSWIFNRGNKFSQTHKQKKKGIINKMWLKNCLLLQAHYEITSIIIIVICFMSILYLLVLWAQLLHSSLQCLKCRFHVCLQFLEILMQI